MRAVHAPVLELQRPESFRDGLYVNTKTRTVMSVDHRNPDQSIATSVFLSQPIAMAAKCVPGVRQPRLGPQEGGGVCSGTGTCHLTLVHPTGYVWYGTHAGGHGTLF